MNRIAHSVLVQKAPGRPALFKYDD